MTPLQKKAPPVSSGKGQDYEIQPGGKFDWTGKGPGKDVFYADAGKPKAGASKAKAPPTKDDLKNLVPFLGDDQIFGVFATDYQKERNKKYLRLTLAILSIRSYLKGDGDVAAAKQRIADWRSEPTLIQDHINVHAGKNIVWVLDRAKGDPGVDELLKAIRADYSAEAAEKAKPKPKSQDEILVSLGYDAIFGDQHEAFKKDKKEKVRKYLKVDLAIIEVKKFLAGDADALASSKTRLVEWLQQSELLADPVALRARKNLIALLGVPAQDEDLGKSLQDLVGVLKADYTPKPPPSAEEKKPEEKKPDAPKAEEPKPEEPKTKSTVTVFFTAPKVPGKRDDNMQRMVTKCRTQWTGVYERYLKSYPDLQATVTLNFKVDNKTGAITEVRFSNIKSTGTAAPEAVEEMLREIAAGMYSVVSFEKQGSEPSSEILLESLEFKPKAK